jgi:hypothetical protein
MYSMSQTIDVLNHLNSLILPNEYFIANNRILQFTSRNIVTSLFSLATTDIDLARLRHSTYPSVLVGTCEMMNWPNNLK